jgi:hypothetical protein
MKYSKSRFRFRPRVENLESRLQPGSIITGSGYGSLLADSLPVLNQDGGGSASQVSQSTSETSQPTQTSTPADSTGEHLSIAVVSVAAASSTSLPANNVVDNSVSTGLTNDDLFNAAPTESTSALLMAAAASTPIQMPPPATPAAGVPQSPTGVAAPALPAAPVQGPASAPGGAVTGSATGRASGTVKPAGPGVQAVPAHSFRVAGATAHTVTGYQANIPVQVTSVLHSSPVIRTDSGNQATLNFLSYFGGGATPFQGQNLQGPGPDTINSVVVDNEGGSNFIYVAGSLTDATGRTDFFVAKLADGATSVVWAETLIFGATAGPGPDSATGLAVNTSGVYVVGSLADPAATPQTDGVIVQLDPGTGASMGSGVLTGATFAAVGFDPSGDVDVGGSVADSMNSGQTDLYLTQLTPDLQTSNYGYSFPLTTAANDTPSNAPANTAVATGSDLIVDSVGNVYFAGTFSVVGNTDNNTDAFYGQFLSGGTSVSYTYFFNDTSGPGGIMTALAFDPSGNVVFTGSVNDNATVGAPTLLNQDMLLGRADASGNILDGNTWFVDNRSGNATPATARIGDWQGNSLVVLPDGSAIVGGAAYDPAAGTAMGDPTSKPTQGIDVTITHFGVGDGNTTQNGDGDPENDFGGSGTDVGTAIALDPNASASPYNVYVVGTTTSSDLPTTSGVVQQTFAGGTTTGFVGAASIA